MKKIWCLFSVANNYDQPDNNLVCFWAEKPNVDAWLKFWDVDLTLTDDKEILGVLGMLKGEQFMQHDCWYRLEQVNAGERI